MHIPFTNMTKKMQALDSPNEQAATSPTRKSGAKFLRFRRGKRDATEQRESAAAHASNAAVDTSISSLHNQESPEAPHSRTAILTLYDPLLQQRHTCPLPQQEKEEETNKTISLSTSAEEASTPPPKPWFNFTLCARPSDVRDEEFLMESSSSSSDDGIPDDPTVQESIECVFAHQVQDVLTKNDMMELTSPATLLQSRTRTRSVYNHSGKHKQYHANSLVHLGTYDPQLGKVLQPPPSLADSDSSMPDGSSYSAPAMNVPPCLCTCGVKTPLVPPESWPQRPLLLRPTPGTGMKVLGIRFSSCQQYLWKEGDALDCIQWYEKLQRHWNPSQNTYTSHNVPATCSECLLLPINNGNEPKGEALVADFESLLFSGTVLVRVRHANGTTPQPYNDASGYFAGMNRRYQIVIRGSFKEEVPWTSCVAGVQLERPVGNLPPKWIMNGALKVVSFFAPQLKASTEGTRPYSVSPFGSTPQTLRVDDAAPLNETLEEKHHEPLHDHHTLLGKASKHSSSLHRARFRKRNFDKLHVQESPIPVTLSNKVYTFEFLQHLLNMQEMTIELGNMLGHVQLKEILNGQPLQIMAQHAPTQRKIWSFDLWHECLIEDSKKYDAKV